MSTSPGSSNAAGSTPPVRPPTQSTRMFDRLKASWSNPSKRPMLIFGFGAVGIAVLLLVVAAFQLVSGTGSAEPVPTPVPTCAGPNCPIAQSSPLVPKKLYVRDRTYEITPVAVQKGKWPTGNGDSNASWVFGSLVNYLIGLPNTTENKDLMQALSAADKITLELSDGQTVDFKFDAQQLISPDNHEIFSQQHPGLTLFLLGDDSAQRLVVTTNYDVTSEANRTVPGNVVAINTPIEIGDVRVKVLNGRLVENAPGIPVGSAFYLVDFTAENTGTDALNVSNFAFELLDYARQKYKLSDVASKLGPNPPPGGQLLPGLSASFTTGFEVPSNITGPILTWVFKPDASFRGQASVAVPLLGPTPTPDPRSQARVQISQAYYTPDRSEIIIVGSIANPTTALIPVSPADVVLSTPEGILATLNSADPALPWRLAPNDTLNFTLHFSRLPSATAILKILSNSFELTIQ
jgi:hypothetical protein